MLALCGTQSFVNVLPRFPWIFSALRLRLRAGLRRKEGFLLISFHGPKGPFFHRAQPRRLCHKGMATRASTPPREARVGGPSLKSGAYKGRSSTVFSTILPSFLLDAKAKKIVSWEIRSRARKW